MTPYTNAEIHRINMENIVLRWKKRWLPDYDVTSIDFIEPLDPIQLSMAIRSLRDFTALDEIGALTNHGSNMAEFPVEPHFANAIIASVQYNCIIDVINIVAMLTGNLLLYTYIFRYIESYLLLSLKKKLHFDNYT